MPKLTDYTTYADAQRLFSTARLWELFDGNRESLNIGHECVDRHASRGRVALRVAHADGADETITFADTGGLRHPGFAHWLDAAGRNARRSSGASCWNRPCPSTRRCSAR